MFITYITVHYTLDKKEYFYICSKRGIKNVLHRICYYSKVKIQKIY